MQVPKNVNDQFIIIFICIYYNITLEAFVIIYNTTYITKTSIAPFDRIIN